MFGRAPRLSTSQRKQIASKRKRNSDGTFAGAGSTIRRHSTAMGAVGTLKGADYAGRGFLGNAFSSHTNNVYGLVQKIGAAVPDKWYGAWNPHAGGLAVQSLTAAGMAAGIASGVAAGVGSHYLDKKTGSTLKGWQKTTSALAGAAGGYAGGPLGGIGASLATTGTMIAANKLSSKWKSRKRSK